MTNDKSKKEDEVLDDKRNQPVKSNDENVTDKSETERKTASQDRTDLEDTDHVQYHLDKDPNDPRNRPVAGKLPSLDDENQK